MLEAAIAICSPLALMCSWPAFPFVCRNVVSSLELSVVLSSSSDPSMLSKALALATGDFGEVGLIRAPAFLACPLDFPSGSMCNLGNPGGIPSTCIGPFRFSSPSIPPPEMALTSGSDPEPRR
uniref:AMP deaminase n=1 Tax=Rhizophora mucronata TaxID=61149 RepID=A0A2P2LH32_RHIMU